MVAHPRILSRSEAVLRITRNRSRTRANALPEWRLTANGDRRKELHRSAPNRSGRDQIGISRPCGRLLGVVFSADTKTMKTTMVAMVMLMAAGPVFAQPQPDQSKQVGHFTVKNSVDEFGKAQATAETVGEHATTLMWVCTPGREPGVQVGWVFGRVLVGQAGRIHTTYRFGQGRASEATWELAGSNKGVFAAPTFTSNARMAQMSGNPLSGGAPSETLLIRVTDRDGDAVTETFTLTGLDLALAHLPCSEAAGLPNALRDKLLKESQK